MNKEQKNLGGRPRLGISCRRQMNVGIDDELRAMIREEAKRDGVSVSAIVNEAIEAFLIERRKTRKLVGITEKVVDDFLDRVDPRITGDRWRVSKI